MKTFQLWLISYFIQVLHFNPTERSECKEGEINEDGRCVPCSDEKCTVCMSENTSSCLECASGFELIYQKCGLNCNSFSNCDICSPDLSECIHCKQRCSVKDGQCTCAPRNAIIIVCVLISAIIVGIIIYCLTKPTAFTQYKVNNKKPNDNNNNNSTVINQAMTQRQAETEQVNINYDGCVSNKVDEVIQIDDLFNFNKVVVGEVNEKQACDQCKELNGNVKLNCGCCLCYNDSKVIENSTETIKHCPVCSKEIVSMKQFTCGICFQNKTELSKFLCMCSLFICKECFVITKKTNKNCPGCRSPI